MEKREWQLKHFLSEDEQQLISRYIHELKKMPYVYDEHGHKGPKLKDRQALKELMQRKCQEWNNCLCALVPKTSVTWRAFIEKNQIKCAIKEFLKKLNNILEENTSVYKHQDMLEVLDNGLQICGTKCPCPAEKKAEET